MRPGQPRAYDPRTTGARLYGLGQAPSSNGTAAVSLPSTGSSRASSGGATQTCAMGMGPQLPWEVYCPVPAVPAASAQPAAATISAAVLLFGLWLWWANSGR
jgi:hypothetical protein